MVALPLAVRQFVAEQRAERAFLDARLLRPVQAVVQAVAAQELLRVLEHAVAVVVDLGVVHLCVVVGAHRLHGGQLVATDAPRADLLAAGLGIEAPAVRALDQRQREGQGRVADHQVRPPLPHRLDHALFPVEGEEGVDVLALDVVGGDPGLPVVPEQRGQAHGIALLGAQRADQRLDGGVRTGIGLLGADVQHQQGQQRRQEITECGIHGESPFNAHGRRHGRRRPVKTMGPIAAPTGRCCALPAADWRRRDWSGRG
ncbi:hypothetical protein D3C78_1070340 [compost metagenome]